jgi:hypothetical protein
LLAKLVAFKPDIVTHEGISGEQCDTFKRFAAVARQLWWPVGDDYDGRYTAAPSGGF